MSVAPIPPHRTVWSVAVEFLQFLRREKKWWLVPLVLALMLIGFIVVFGSGSALAPFLYPFI